MQNFKNFKEFRKIQKSTIIAARKSTKLRDYYYIV